MKKRVIALTMAALMAASLTACGGSAKETTAAAAADTTAAAKEESTAAESTAAESKEAAGGKLVMATMEIDIQITSLFIEGGTTFFHRLHFDYSMCVILCQSTVFSDGFYFLL